LRRRRRGLFLLLLLGLLVSVSVAAGLFPVYANPSDEYDYVDNNTSDVDTSPDRGTHSNFTDQQYGPDSIYDALNEENTGGIDETTYDYSAGAGLTKWAYKGQASSPPADGPDITGQTEVADYTLIESSNDVRDSSGPCSPGRRPYFNFKFTISENSITQLDLLFEGSPLGAGATVYLRLWNFTGSAWDIKNSTVAAGGQDENFTATITTGITDYINANGYLYFVVQDETNKGTIYCDYVKIVVTYFMTNYDLDLEVQWTNATHDLTNEQLCIFGGAMGSENLRIDVWDGFTWQSLFNDLSSGWNNISITDYLISSTFTIRFKGGTETADTYQDSWEIDCTLLRTWGVPPVANFSCTPEYPYVSETVTFNASSSYDPDGSIVTYFWDFGDGTNATGEITTHIYTDDGTYTVTITVTDNDGLSDITSKGITVLNRPPIATFTESAETVYTSEPITFNASDSYDLDGSIVSYYWDFGDGTNATSIAVGHSYADDGNYTITLTITDDDEATDLASATKSVLNRPPAAIFTESATTALTGEIIYFDASDSYDPDGTINSYLWDFGDGINAIGVVVDHAYVDDGTYTVALTVTDDDDATDTATSTKTVLNRPPVAFFTESVETIYTEEIIYFNASASYDPDGVIISYFWDFGDGTNTTGVTTEHSYPQEGNYTVTLTVNDDDGATNLTSAGKTVLNRPPIASFTESTETVYTSETIYFNATTSYDPDGSIISYFWDFGDGSNGTGVTVDHSYINNGNYVVTLTVTDDDGATDSTIAFKTVLNRPPIAAFTESTQTVYTNETITFNATNSHDPDGSIVGYFWDFGDGTNATGVTTDHSFADDGNYTVALTVTDDDGATNIVFSTKTVLNRPPVASFTESAETVYTGETIYFDASGSSDPDGSIVSYFWDFGDSTNAIGVVVDHAYVDDGNYTVTLTITDDDGATETATATKTVLNRSPVASFTESAETIYTSETITFNASASYDSDGSIVSYFWDFGDGANATGIIVEHSYPEDGNYTVTLVVTDDDGATDAATSTKTVLNRPPVASFTESAETIYVDEVISFNASVSYDLDGSIAGYFWDFGDGTNATGIIVNHTYLDDGIHIVTLTITDNDGATGLATATKTVLNKPPVAIFTESAETVYVGEPITFNATNSYDPDGMIVSYFWDFGDGANATGITVNHAFATNGTFTVTLTITDDDGATDSASSTKTILMNESPVASFTESVETVYTNEPITFNASSSYDPDGIIVSYEWDFGDGTNATGIVVERTYVDDGIYTITLTVTDDKAATDTATSVKTVLNRSPVASFTESAETVYTDEVVSFNASASYDLDGTIVSYFWNFDDETNATGVTVNHAYADNGYYTVTLTVTDDDGATDTATAAKTVLNRSPVASFTESAETIYTNEAVTFNASASYDSDGSIVSYFWDFGDGANATGIIVDHAYADDGIYAVTLTVTDDDGATDAATSTKTVLNRPPVASFTESAETVYTSEAITFNASDSYDPDGMILSYFWDLGDGANATDVTVNHAYADDGNYTVTLTVTDDDGATALVSATKMILNRHPVALFTESAETVLTQEIITFNASSSYDPDGLIVSYFWDFGDGANATGAIVEYSYVDDGDYSVTLTITDNDGATDTASATKFVLNRSPLASFTESAETINTGETVHFNASQSYDPDGMIVSYFWNFGDGSNATGIVVDLAYADDGNYTVTLTVTDDDGTTDTTTSTKTVLNRPPVASFTESAETVYTGETIHFDASSSLDLDGSVVSYFWDFGDGTNATEVTVDHAYVDDGIYTVTLTVTDDDGATNSDTAIKTVLNRPPLATFTESAEVVYINETIYLNASDSYDLDGTIVSYWWDFGDGTNATGVTTEHSYSQEGNYTVILTVTDDDGATNSTSANKTVLNRPPIAVFTESAETVYTGDTISFNASESYDLDGIIISYFWDFGDGTNNTSIVTDHAYADDGNYTVTLIITDNDGALASTSSIKTILNRPPLAFFTESAETVYTSVTITFDASTSYDPDGTVVSYFWDFGDGTNATGITVGHSYADDGNYMVTLTVTDNDGAIDTATAIKTILNRSPVAIFTESASVVYTGEVIYFDALQSHDPDGVIVGYFWDFGDGTNATGVTVEHAYTDDGNYVVTLTVTDDDGAAGTATSTKKVLNRPPVAFFTESAETVYTSVTITFNASDGYDPDGAIVSYFWDFGDSTNATGIIVNHAYSEDGTYTVTLTVTDDDDATASAGATKTVLNRPPVAIFTESAETVLVDEVIYFNASVSHDPDGSIVSYFWDFGDGTNATDVTTEHAYADNGVYTVTLTITDNDGATTSATATKNVEVTPPVAIFTESAVTVYTGEFIYFNASASYDSDGVLVSYFWDFGDGTNATGVTAEYAYTDNGNYTVILTVTDDDGVTNSATTTKTVLNRAPSASFSESAETVYTDEVITFNASASYDPDGSIATYFWDFGDGTNTTGIVTNHSFANNGNCTITLTVTDDDGATGVATATKTVLNRPPVASFTESTETVFTGEVISFNASASYDPDGIITSRFWDFGDNTNATGTIVDHTYSEDGNYTVTLTVTDDDGASSSSIATKTVLNNSPVASFTETAETVYSAEIIAFNASASYDPDGTVVSYFWDFGDGINTTGVIVDHAYADDGDYTVTLTVTDDDGASSSTSVIKTVLNRSPIASFTESTETVLVGEVIYFNASESYDPDGVVVSYFWDFGDGTNATGMTTEHGYADDGVYTATLTVTDDDGATASTSATKTVGITPPVATFTESAETVLTGETIMFNASASYDFDGVIVSYFWDFGDGTNATSVIVVHSYVDDGVYNVTLTVTDDDGATASAVSTKTVLNRSPVPSFTESATTLSTDEVISFDASASYDSDGTIVSYFWDFGDGSNATGVIVGHAYVSDGVYTATLTVTDDDGATASTSATKMVLNRSPVASFAESAETVYTNEIISFDASASYDPDGAIVSYFWDFGDGTNATGVIVDHAFADDGIYTATLTVADDDNATATDTSTKTVLNRSPVASFTESAETVYTSDVITLNASNSYDLDGTIVSYFWDFGDGTNATGVVVDRSYADDGVYTVTLTILDDDGASVSASATKTVLNRSPVALFTESVTTVFTGEVIYFNASASYDSDGIIVSYFWDFGDGTNATGVIVDHAYVDDGTYTVILTVTDDDGVTTSTSATKTVLNRSPVASFTESAETVYTNEIISFNASASYDSDGTIVSYFWDFGDGTNSTGMIVEYSYVDDGTYSVTLTVTDDDGATGIITSTKTVLNRPPVALFTETAETVLTDEIITFNASASYDPDDYIISYLWDFGDSTNSTGAIVDHAYVDDGVYTVTLTVTDDDGATASATATKIVSNRSPVASFTESAENVLTGEVIYFNASGSYDPDGYVVSYFWDFGDGINAMGVTTEHSYAEKGNYIVTLTVTDDDGATASAIATKIVGNSSPVAIFTESAAAAYTGMVISFDASSSYDPDGVIVDYFWDFGDGTNAAGLSVGHAYADDGNYTVTLTVTDDADATATATSIKTILNRSPVSIFSESATVVYTGVVIHFDASTSYDSDGVILSYFWDFGDDTNATDIIVEHAYIDDGNYFVTLTLIDDDGATGMASSTKTVLNRSPVASFTESAETVYTEEVIHFDASASYDPDGYLATYFWDFGDGTNASNVILDHAFIDEGTYIVTLTVTDNDGATTSVSATKIVLSTSPVALFTESAEIVYTDEVIYFNASASYDPNGVIVSYFWDFGDSTNATGVTVNHSYADDGIYTVILTVTDNEGETSSATSTKTILNRFPVASFTESAETVYTGESITFNASGSYDPDGVIVSCFWDFNDGTNATGVLAEHAYVNDGNYTVALTVTDDDGSVVAAVATKTILNRSPSASFIYSPSYPIVGEIVAFNASASYDLDGYVVDYAWNFGDNTTTTVATPIVSHTYAIEGDYTVTLTITDDDSATNNSTDVVMVRNYPTAAFTYSPDPPAKNQSIIFNASSSVPNGGIITSYQWDFGDGNITAVSGPILTHVYSSEGNYTVVLNVTDSEGLSDSLSQTIRVGLSPVSSFTYSPATLYVGDTATFNASASYDPDGSIISYLWDFGDGSLPVNETDPITIHVYVSDGVYSVALTVTDNEGINATNSTMITVLRAPVASFTYSPGFVLVGDVVTFDASESYDPNGYIMNYTWDFGDGNITATTSPITTHTYATAKTYVVILTVTDNEGFTDEKTKFVRIREYPTASFMCIPDYPIAGEDVTFDASSSTPNGGSIDNYHWDFGDGSLPVDTPDPILTYLYTTVGDYVVTLTVSDSEDLSDTTSTTVSVRDYPTATFQYSPTPPTAGLPVNFDGSSSTPGQGGSITDYAWDFGDGNITTTTTSMVVHVYAKAGNYTAVLTVTDSEGLSDLNVELITVEQASPVAAFVYSPDPAVKGGIVTFNASKSHDPDGQIWVYHWRFGDGETDLGWDSIVTHVYTALGQYNVTLTVEDLDENTDAISKIVTVIAGPHVDFTWEPQYPEINEVIAFDASESYDPTGSIVNYTWDFGDGNSTTVFESIITHQYGAPANYTVALNVTNDQGLWNIRQKLVSVIVTGPYVDFSWTPSDPYVNETVLFDASNSIGTVAEIANYTWHFGDGETITVVDPVVYYAYASEGNYTVALNVTDTRGFWSTASKIISILPLSGPTADFTWPYPCYPNRTITFDASTSTSGWNGTDHPPIVSYMWDFGDGNITTISVFAINHTYVQPGNYIVALTVTDELDQSDTVSYVVAVSEKLLGDVNGDGKVRIDDILAVALAFGSEPGDPNWDPDCDVNGDGKVRVDDILIAAQNFGQELP